MRSLIAKAAALLAVVSAMASSMAGAQLAEKSLERSETDVDSLASVELSIPADNSLYVGAAMLNPDTLETADVTDRLDRQGTALRGRVPAERWHRQGFPCYWRCKSRFIIFGNRWAHRASVRGPQSARRSRAPWPAVPAA